MSAATLPAPVEAPAPAAPAETVHIVVTYADVLRRWLNGDQRVRLVALCGEPVPPHAVLDYTDRPECPACLVAEAKR
jgi:hypothetical protein